MNQRSLYWMRLLVEQSQEHVQQVGSPELEPSSDCLHQHIGQHTQVAVLLPLDVLYKVIEHLHDQLSLQQGMSGGP